MDSSQQEFLKEIGRRVKARRRELKMTQAQLAFEAGMETRQIQRLEKGEANVGVINLLSISLALDIKVSTLLETV